MLRLKVSTLSLVGSVYEVEVDSNMTPFELKLLLGFEQNGHFVMGRPPKALASSVSLRDNGVGTREVLIFMAEVEKKRERQNSDAEVQPLKKPVLAPVEQHSAFEFEEECISCKNCTFGNKLDAKTCDMCESVLPNVFEEKPTWFELQIVGTRHRKDAWRGVQKGQALSLIPEENNPHDENALAVLSLQGRPLGYLARAAASKLSPLLRAGSIKVKSATLLEEETVRFCFTPDSLMPWVSSAELLDQSVPIARYGFIQDFVVFICSDHPLDAVEAEWRLFLAHHHLDRFFESQWIQISFSRDDRLDDGPIEAAKSEWLSLLSRGQVNDSTVVSVCKKHGCNTGKWIITYMNRRSAHIAFEKLGIAISRNEIEGVQAAKVGPVDLRTGPVSIIVYVGDAFNEQHVMRIGQELKQIMDVTSGFSFKLELYTHLGVLHKTKGDYGLKELSLYKIKKS